MRRLAASLQKRNKRHIKAVFRVGKSHAALRQLGSQREEIVRDLSGRIAKIQPPPAPAPRHETRRTVIGPHNEYVVEAGDTLSLISQATGVPIRKIKEMNNLKNDNLRIGQKLMLPK